MAGIWTWTEEMINRKDEHQSNILDLFAKFVIVKIKTQ